MAIRDLEDNIARLTAASERAEEATRQAREAVKDLLAIEKRIQLMIGKELESTVNERINEVATKGLKELGEHFKQASDATYQRVIHQADLLINISLGKEGAVRKDQEDLRPMLAEKLREWVVAEIRKVT